MNTRDPNQELGDFAREVLTQKFTANISKPVSSTSDRVESSSLASPGRSLFPTQNVRSRQDSNVTIRKHKPFPFALEWGESGAMCYYGSLSVSVTYATDTAVTGGNFIYQDPIGSPAIFNPSNLNVIDGWSYLPTKLNAFGDVHLKWTCDEEATILSCEVVVEDSPTDDPIPAYDSSVGPTPYVATYYFKIGRVDEDGTVTQLWSSDYNWSIHLLRGGSSD